MSEAIQPSDNLLATEIAQARPAIRRSADQLELITNALPVLIAHVDANQRYAFVNAGYERWFGRSRHEILGRQISEVLGESTYTKIRDHVERALSGEQVAFEAEIPFREGGSRFIHATYVPQRDGHGGVSGFVALVDDITERKQLERSRREYGDRAQRLLRITAALAEAVTNEQVLGAVVDQVAAAVDASSAGLWVVDEDGRTARLARSLGYSESAKEAFASLPLEASPSIPALDAIRLGEPLWIASQFQLLERYPQLRAVATPERAYRVCCLPLIAHGRVLGTLALTVEEEREPTEDERGFLLLVARYASQALERLRLFEAERRSRDEADAAAEHLRVLSQENAEARSRAELLHRLAQVVMTAEKVESVFDAALDAITAALATQRAAILLFDDEGVMRFRAWRGLSDDYRQAVEGHSPWARDVIGPQAVLVPDVDSDPAMTSYLPLFRQEGIGALAFIPLVTRGRLLGKFMVYYDRTHEFSSHELEMAGAIANHVASVSARFAAVAKLEETVRHSELFAGALAHDLRNPLNAMMTAAQIVLMRQEGDGDRGARPLRRILTSGQRMSRMIDQLLDFTRARSGGGLNAEPHDLNLSALCAQAIGELELAFPEWKIESEVLGDPRGTWDPDRLLQVVSNLIGNAGQHGAGATIRVTVDGRRSEEVTLEVHNKGAIPEALVPRLFDPFRGTMHRRDQSRGLGLGLFIVKQIVRAHRGSVSVSSSEETGTTFTVRLPRHTAQPGGAR